MRLAMVVERPTQFEAPLFRHAASDAENELRVLYTDPAASEPALDPEMGRRVGWGSDLLGGHEHAVAPMRGRARWLHRELAARRDLVIVNGYTRRAYLAAIAAARRAGSPLALRLDSVLFDEGPPLRRLAKRLLFRTAVRPLFGLFFGVSTLTLAYLRTLGVADERMALLPYPIDAAGMRRSPAAADAARAAWRARLTVPPSAPVVLAVAKLHPRETPWDLLRAWVGAAGTDRWLWIAGDGPQRAAVERLVRESALPRVRLLGYVPYPELPDLYPAADLFVHAPREERWGVSVGEALACGLPVVASSRVGAAHDLVVTGVNGFTYPAADSAALAATIGSALALDRGQAMRASEPLIAAWGLEATWSGMVASARRLSGSAA